VLTAWAALNASLGLLLGSLARTEAQAAAVGVVASMILAALGGCWWPIEVAPGWMQRLALFLPSGWTMNALHRLVSFGDPGWSVLPQVAALTAAAVITGWATTRAFRFE
jgi:ABC-type multidrug transport system permease subunit